MWDSIVTDFVPESEVCAFFNVDEQMSGSTRQMIPHCHGLCDPSAGFAQLGSPITFHGPQQQASGHIWQTPPHRYDTLAAMPPTESPVICPVPFDENQQRTLGRFQQPIPLRSDSFSSAAEIGPNGAPAILPDIFHRQEQNVHGDKRSTEVCVPAGQYRELAAMLRRNRNLTSPSCAKSIDVHHQPGPLAKQSISQSLPVRLSRAPGHTLADTTATAVEGIQLSIILEESKEQLKFTIDAGQTSANAVQKFIDQFGLEMDYYMPLRTICDACISGAPRPIWHVELDDSRDSLCDYEQAGLTNPTTCLASSDTQECTILMEHLKSRQFKFCPSLRSFVVDVRQVPLGAQTAREGRISSSGNSTFDSSALMHVTLQHILPRVADHIGQDMVTAMVRVSILTAARMVHPHPGTCVCEREAINANEPLQIELYRQLLDVQSAQGSTCMDQLRGRLRRLFDWLQEALIATHPNQEVLLRSQKLDPTLESAIHCIYTVLQKSSSVAEDCNKWMPEWIWTNIFATCFASPKGASIVEDFGSEGSTTSTHTLSSCVTPDNDTITETGSSIRTLHAVDKDEYVTC
ncbi:hypothetical protein LTR82_017738 [Friedmanniomyces endolithicus]|uniref:Uncharacterized protein n=1 Tax=Friedmanniomyces endolithicus TaxID=329885 RepID=A0AAN6J0H6_9PEZI|nr:hypothetical protein LTR82_017738 [Friedmanniomyces endolithicus]